MFWYVSSWVVVIVWHTVYLHRDQPPAAVSSAGPEYKKLCLLELGWASSAPRQQAGRVTLLLVPTSYWLKGVSRLMSPHLATPSHHILLQLLTTHIALTDQYKYVYSNMLIYQRLQFYFAAWNNRLSTLNITIKSAFFGPYSAFKGPLLRQL